ncbi:hypothetical protein RJ639_021060 [Escallonia herrerae]|uniref:Apple domain-containing protein n=1 Tax=Escallonia herrerae TaxID=1293975 RepID=A0AA88V3K3_9ASTE|nr:hypothetical protein RJ639_021060 [Escallonia herrerae]
MNFSFINTNDEVYLTFQLPDDSIFTRFVLGQGGTVQRTVWLKDRANGEEWVQFWEAPEDRCDQYARCRTAALCNSNDIKVVCTCLPGFARESDQWNTNCVEKQKGVHACGKGNGEGFVKIPSLRIPDARNAISYPNLSMQECGKECLKSCNCTGYASADVTTGGRGCFAWNGELNDMRQYDKDGQDFYLRVDAEELANSKRNSKGSSGTTKVLIIIIFSAVSGVLLVICAFFSWRKHAKKKGQRQRQRYREMILRDSTANVSNEEFAGANKRGESGNIELTFFDLDAIKAATDNFSPPNKLGQGGFGPVYKVLSHMVSFSSASNALSNPRGALSGYMSPEYALDGLFSEKSDVFSFGVLLLEVISGRKNIGFFRQDPDSNLMRYAWDLWNSNRALELVDSSMGDAYPADEVMRCIQVGLLCVQDQAIDRPTMVSIVFMLCNKKVLPLPKQPVFAVKTGQSNRSNVDSVSTGTKSSVNEVTFTMLDAR